MLKLFRPIWSLAIIVSLFGTLVSVSSGFAATVTSANDDSTTLQTSTQANHRVIFTTPSGVSMGSTITLTFSTAFDTSSIIEDDVDISDDGVDLTTAPNCAGTEQASVVMASDVLTITICAGDGGAIAAASQVIVEIGTNATASGTGANRIVNPTSYGTFFVSIDGTFGDFGSIALPISSTDDTVSVSAFVPAVTSGGSGGGGNQGDTTAPVITNIVVSGVTATAATISWSTNESADSAVYYGLTPAFELGVVTSATFETNHTILLSGLTSGGKYFFQVRSKDVSKNEGVSSTLTFSTLDLTAPIVSLISVVDITATSARVIWTTNEPANSFVEYGLSASYGLSKTDKALVTSHSVTLTGLSPSTVYHFRVQSSDSASNNTLSADQTFSTLADSAPANVSGLTIKSGNSQLSLTWTNPPDSDLSGILVLECLDGVPSGPNDQTVCTQVLNELAESLTRTGLSNGKTYYYGVFAYDAAGQFASGAVGSGIPTASEEEVPIQPEPKVPFEEPLEEPSKEPAGDQGIFEPGIGLGQPTLLGAGAVKLKASDLEIVVAGGKIVLSLGAKGAFDVLPAKQIRLQVNADDISDAIELLTLSIDSETFLLHLADEQDGSALFFADVITPQTSQLYAMSVLAEYKDGSQETVSSFLNVVPFGTAVQVIDAEEIVLGGVKVTLSQVVNGKTIVWDGSPYDQDNPVTTGFDGTFGWYVPNGTFSLLGNADNFLSYHGDSIAVDNHIVNQKIVMAGTVLQTGKEPTILVKTLKQVLQTFSRVIISPEVLDLVTPALAISAGASLVILIMAFDFIPLLQYLFTAPVLLLWRRKRKGFGVVYNAISRAPVDLSVVRLYLVEDETASGPGRLVKSRVTDKGGRFFFLVPPGVYRITATKAGFRFPTDYLKDAKNDGAYLDVYHGEIIRVTDKDAVMTPNIPLDPAQAGQTQASSRVVWQGRLRTLQQGVGVSGVLISIAVAMVRPSVLAAGMIAIQAFVYLLVLRLAKSRKPKSWGIVYDKVTKRPLSHVIARIFEPKYNKLLDTQVTDSKGRYAFLLGPSQYFAVFEKSGYRPTQVRPIDLRESQGSQDFGVDVELHPDSLAPRASLSEQSV